MRRFMLSLLMVLFAFSALAEETVLGASGDETIIVGSPYFHIFGSTFDTTAELPAAGTYTYSSKCFDFATAAVGRITIGSNCTGENIMHRSDKPIVFTRLAFVSKEDIGASNDFGCKFRLFAETDGGIAASEVVINGQFATGAVFQSSFNHRVAAGAQYSIEAANADGCSAGSSCDCAGAAAERFNFYLYGVEQ